VSTRSCEALAVVLVVGMVVFVGCGGQFGPTLPSPDAAPTNEAPTNDLEPGPGPGPVNTLCGQVTDENGDPLPDAAVAASDGQSRWTAETDAEGRYCFESVGTGQIAVAVGRAGYGTEYRTTDYAGGSATLDVQMDEPVAANPEDCPVIEVELLEFDEVVGTVRVVATVANTDADTVILFQDGQPSIMSLADLWGEAVSVGGREFEQLAFLHPGTNTFRVFAANAGCTTLSEPVTQEWTPPEGSDFYFRVTLTWDTDTSDIDLHAWTPDDQHMYYGNGTVNAGELDVDDVDGYGPENFTVNSPIRGRYRIAVNSYDLSDADHANCLVRVISGGLASNSVVRTYGPYRFTGDNGNEGYPVTGNTDFWWRPVDIIFDESDGITVAGPDSTALHWDPANPTAVIPAAAVSK